MATTLMPGGDATQVVAATIAGLLFEQWCVRLAFVQGRVNPVSYTHLDVYKRQAVGHSPRK